MAHSNLLITVQLVLTADEAGWLQAQLQNPLHDVEPDHEDEADRKNRIVIFNALRSISAQLDDIRLA